VDAGADARARAAAEAGANRRLQSARTCGREGCDEVLTLALEEHAFVREQPYRFLVPPVAPSSAA
jgi:hypothetical protein